MTSKYKELQKRVREKYGERCCDCGREEEGGKRLAVHHLDGDDTNNNPNNLIPLCNGCHTERHFLDKYVVWSEGDVKIAKDLDVTLISSRDVKAKSIREGEIVKSCLDSMMDAQVGYIDLPESWIGAKVIIIEEDKDK